MAAVIVAIIIIVFLLLVVNSFSKRRSGRRRYVRYESHGKPGRKRHISFENVDTVSVKAARKLLDDGKNRVIVFDTETNGLTPTCSVLSLSAIKFEVKSSDYDLVEIDRFDRFYFPKERLNSKAVAVNHLSRQEISKRRGAAEYPEHFCDDGAAVAFFADSELVVSHNIEFDAFLVKFVEGKKKFCTMKTATGLPPIPWTPLLASAALFVVGNWIPTLS